MRKYILLILLLGIGLLTATEYPAGMKILKQIDNNMYATSTVSTSKMVVRTKRGERTMVIKSYGDGDNNSFSEYLAPPREAGTKMLKLDDKLWIYEPSSDRTIQLSGNMLRQSVMGSDLSYEDFMEETKLSDLYEATVTGEAVVSERDCWLLDLKAKVKDIAYPHRLLWVDKKHSLALKEERYAKSGKLLKTTIISEVMEVEGRFYPKVMTFKDELKKGKGTDIIIDEISFKEKIPSHIFTKSALRK